MAFQTPFSFGGYQIEWLQIFLYFIMILVKNWPMSAFQLLENHVWSWVMSHGSFLINLDLWLTYDSHIYNTHILWLRILRRFFAHKIFLNPPTQIFKYRFSLKCVGVIFFRPHRQLLYFCMLAFLLQLDAVNCLFCTKYYSVCLQK